MTFNINNTINTGSRWTYLIGKNGKDFTATPMDDYTIDDKLYGDVFEKTTHILKSYSLRDHGTGVLLEGEKGSGKTLTMKLLSCRARTELKIPTLIVNKPYAGDEFNMYIKSLPECVLCFDEFEKVYSDRNKQSKLLTLYDGLFSTKKLIIKTVNNSNLLDTNFINRPSRIYYRLKYTSLSARFIAEYCEDELDNMKDLRGILKLATLQGSFNFDTLQALIEEMNRFKTPAKEAAEMLNISIDSNIEYTIYITSNDEAMLTNPAQQWPKRIFNNPLMSPSISLNWECLPASTEKQDDSPLGFSGSRSGPVRHSKEFKLTEDNTTTNLNGSEYTHIDKETNCTICFKMVNSKRTSFTDIM